MILSLLLVFVFSLLSLKSINGDLAILKFSKSNDNLKLCSIKKPVRSTDFNKFYSLIDLRPNDGCDLSSSGFLNESVAFITIDAPGNCNLSDIVRNFATKNASFILIGTDGPLKTNLTNSNATISPVFVPLDYANKISRFIENSPNVKIELLDSHEKFDASSVIIWFLALTVVTLGSLWSSFEFKKTLRESSQQNVTINNGINNNNNTQSEAANEDAQPAVQLTTHETSRLSTQQQLSEKSSDNSTLLLSIGYIGILLLLVFVVAMLLLLYFFYNIMIYFIYVIFIIGATSSMYRILSLPLDNFQIATYEVPESFITRKLKWRPQLIKIFTLAICLVVSVIWFVYRHQDWIWIIQNMMAISLALNALSFYRLSTYKTVTIILVVFFVYDVFMVFVSPYITKGTSIMEAVAFGGRDNTNRQTNDVIQFGERDRTDRLPVVIIVPRLSSLAHLCYRYIDYPFSLLGLGDLLIPGLSVNYAILFDLAIGNKKCTRRVYFITNLFAYAFGLLCALVALIFMDMAQPALLYLCPSHLIFTYLVALIRKEVALLWSGKPITDYASLDSISNKSYTNDSS